MLRPGRGARSSAAPSVKRVNSSTGRQQPNRPAAAFRDLIGRRDRSAVAFFGQETAHLNDLSPWLGHLISMNIALVRQPHTSVQAQWLVLGIFEDDAERSPPRTEPSRGDHRPADRREGADGLARRTDTAFWLPGIEAGAVLLVGLGPRGSFDPGAAFSAGFALAKRLAGKRRDGVAVVLPPSENPSRIRFGLDRRGDRRHARARRAENRSRSPPVRDAEPGGRP